MTAQVKHIVKQQILDISVPNLEEEAEISNAFTEVNKNTIESIIDEVCKDLIPENEIIRIDSLEIDVGSINFNKVSTDFPRAIKHSIKEEIYRQIRDGKAESWITPKLKGANEMHQKDSSSSNASLNEEQNATDTNHPRVEESEVNAFFYYLETGLIPWYYTGGLSKLKSEFSNELPLAKRFFEKHSPSNSETFRALHFFNKEVIESWLSQNSPEHIKVQLRDFELVKNILVKLSKSSEEKVSEAARSILNALAPKEKLYTVSMVQLLTATSGSNLLNIVLAWPEKFRNLLEELFQKENVLRSTEFTSEEKILINDFFVEESKVDGKVKSETVTEIEEKLHDETGKTEAFRKTKVAEEIPSKFNPIKQLAVGESLTVNNAGLIIVWPYLQAFFTGLDLMKDRLFLNDEMSIKAVHLLHYLTFKSEAGDETTWMLNKLLCGLSESEFIPEEMNLTSEEMDECENLLTALIKNWPVLKNTSPDSLRNTFLQRNGLLARNENGWVLKIERQAFDILLDKLNWTISTVKLPWNNYMIHTEW